MSFINIHYHVGVLYTTDRIYQIAFLGGRFVIITGRLVYPLKTPRGENRFGTTGSNLTYRPGWDAGESLISILISQLSDHGLVQYVFC